MYFALRCEEVKTVESDVEWEDRIDQRLRGAGDDIRKRVSLHLAPVVGRPPKDLDDLGGGGWTRTDIYIAP